MHEGDNTAEEPARYVEPDVAPARVERLWSAVSERLELPRTRSQRWLWALLTAGALGVAGAFAFSFWPKLDATQSVWENAALETAGDALSVKLVDGSELKLDSRTRVEVKSKHSSSVDLKLEHGRITCDVTHRPGRSFMVTAAGIEVRVVGTRFSVESVGSAASRRVEVRVERGVVEIRSQGAEREIVRLGAGQSFSQVTERGSLPPEGALAEAASPEPTPEPVAAPRPSAPVAAEIGARELLEEANAHRRSGDAQKAAQAYDELLRRFPSDGRAGLAAFELGRLRMDRLGDMSGATRALERAVTLAPGSGFREDAMARLVTAYAALGDSAGCARARGRYLSSFPNGVHRQAVAVRCGSE